MARQPLPASSPAPVNSPKGSSTMPRSGFCLSPWTSMAAEISRNPSSDRAVSTSVFRNLDRIRPPAAHQVLLVNADAAQEDRLVVRQDVRATRLDGAKADAVGDLVGVARQDHVVQWRPLRRPERDLRNGMIGTLALGRSGSSAPRPKGNLGAAPSTRATLVWRSHNSLARPAPGQVPAKTARAGRAAGAVTTWPVTPPVSQCTRATC